MHYFVLCFAPFISFGFVVESRKKTNSQMFFLTTVKVPILKQRKVPTYNYLSDYYIYIKTFQIVFYYINLECRLYFDGLF